jgi:dimethylamine monooxygenase subunit A
MTDTGETGIHQTRLPFAPWMADRTMRLPGTVPIAVAEWLQRDEVFAQQMALRDRLIATETAKVHRIAPGALPAAEELRDLVLSRLATTSGYACSASTVQRPDGVVVPLAGSPLLILGRLIQEDLVLLEKPDGSDEHVLTGGIICLPSNWTLDEKFGLPLARIHLPIERYDAAVAARVQRLLDAVRPEAPLMRGNLLPYAHDRLFSPRREYDRHAPGPGEARFLRSERQVLLRLPATRAVVFSIHTSILKPETLLPEQRARLAEVRPGQFQSIG